MQTLEQNVIQSWIKHHKIENIDIEGDFKWALDKPTIKYIDRHSANLDIPFGKVYIPLRRENSISQELIEKQYIVNVKFLISVNDEEGQKKYKVVFSQNYAKQYIIHDDIFVTSEDICWFNALPKKCRIMAYKFEKNTMESETFLLNQFFKKKTFIHVDKFKPAKTSKKESSTPSIPFLENHMKELKKLRKRVEKLNDTF